MIPVLWYPPLPKRKQNKKQKCSLVKVNFNIRFPKFLVSVVFIQNSPKGLVQVGYIFIKILCIPIEWNWTKYLVMFLHRGMMYISSDFFRIFLLGIFATTKYMGLKPTNLSDSRNRLLRKEKQEFDQSSIVYQKLKRLSGKNYWLIKIW